MPNQNVTLIAGHHSGLMLFTLIQFVTVTYILQPLPLLIRWKGIQSVKEEC